MSIEHVNSTTKDLGSWVRQITKSPIPVLKHTARQIAILREDEDNASPRTIVAAIRHDPMMVFKVLSYAQANKGRQQLQDLLELEQALLMMGADAFFRNIPPAPLVENVLSHDLVAMTRLLKLIRRAHRAAVYAAEWAAHLNDLHSEEVYIAALLHDLSEMLMWCHAPDKMNLIYDMQHQNKALRSKAVQSEVLGFELHELQRYVVGICQLPPLLFRLMEDGAAEERRVRNVILAVNLARHSANGWDDAALPDDYHDIAALLHLDVEKVKRVVGVPDGA